MARSFTNLAYHIVFSTKERRSILRSEIRDVLFPYIAGIAHNLKGRLLIGNGVEDHLHLLLRLHQDVSVADCVRTIKSSTSKWLRETLDPNWLGWQDGYGAFTVSQSAIPSVQEYIRDQAVHHAKTTFQDEFRSLLVRHEIEFDERFLWS